MALPLKYNYRNVLIRWRTTLFTVVGVAAVVSVVVREDQKLHSVDIYLLVYQYHLDLTGLCQA